MANDWKQIVKRFLGLSLWHFFRKIERFRYLGFHFCMNDQYRVLFASLLSSEWVCRWAKDKQMKREKLTSKMLEKMLVEKKLNWSSEQLQLRVSDDWNWHWGWMEEDQGAIASVGICFNSIQWEILWQLNCQWILQWVQRWFLKIFIAQERQNFNVNDSRKEISIKPQFSRLYPSNEFCRLSSFHRNSHQRLLRPPRFSF